MMDASKLLFSLLVLMSTAKWRSETSKSGCTDTTPEYFKLIEGEAFYFVPYHLDDPDLPDENFTWYKTGSENENITTDETHRIHYHGGALFLLNVSTKDSGTYTAKEKTESCECCKHHLEIHVFNKTSQEDLTFGPIKSSEKNIRISCPEPVSYICSTFGGKITWYKGVSLLQGQHEADWWVYDSTKKDEGVYTCICTWTHHHRVYNTSGHRRLIVLEKGFYRKVEILSPTAKMQLADEGVGIKLNCSILCGTNVNRECAASWDVDGKAVEQMDGYNQTIKTVIEEDTQNFISTAILTIERVSPKDFQHTFKCTGVGFYTNDFILKLKQRESVIPLVIQGVCVVFICVLAAVLIRCFAIDIALLFRPYFPLRRHNEVLEDKCGYRLFIQGRDDIPGEDRLELVERCLKQSRRLMVILTPGSKLGSEVTDQCSTSNQTSVIGGYDWQVGLHHALVQRELSVILIQLGDTGPQGYTHLPPGLQHLIRKSAPIRWPEGSRGAAAWNSHFWKRVRYLMPAIPAKKRALSAVI
ncbi:interleukin-1 receptor-like 1 isoform X2 [Kryptolebias marmoratus]|uniref:Interleukin-1 receptor-like 1 n=1 Tax=Kryptolebias marmoratus TaxID=37003 RepID=A0A3Q3AN57_KRYMA|nr:interleukin-1 receptor-like 1 isoform X2 [Kryptolebias marmoratus]